MWLFDGQSAKVTRVFIPVTLLLCVAKKNKRAQQTLSQSDKRVTLIKASHLYISADVVDPESGGERNQPHTGAKLASRSQRWRLRVTHYAIAALRATQPASTFKSVCVCVCVHSCVCVLLPCSVIHTHLSAFLSYFTRSLPVSAQVSPPLLLFSLICTSHTLITFNVSVWFTLCTVCASLTVFVSASPSLFFAFTQML